MSKAAEQAAQAPVAQMGGARRRAAPRFQFSAGSLCLDFAVTLEESADGPVDLLSSPERLGEWLDGPGLPVPAGGLTGTDLAAARDLRGAIGGVVRARIAGAPADPDDVRRVNTFAREPTPVYLLRPGGRTRVAVETADASAALSVVARDAVHLLTGSDVSRLRECARDGCPTLFFDRSPSGRRRWCSMKGCGEIVASASYRRRRTKESP